MTGTFHPSEDCTCGGAWPGHLEGCPLYGCALKPVDLGRTTGDHRCAATSHLGRCQLYAGHTTDAASPDDDMAWHKHDALRWPDKPRPGPPVSARDLLGAATTPTVVTVWRIAVDVPAAVLDDDAKNALFTAVCDAVYDWEPEQRDGWDTDVWATTTDTPARDEWAPFWQSYRDARDCHCGPTVDVQCRIHGVHGWPA